MEDYEMEENVKDKFNLNLYQNQNGTYNLSQDNKYKFYANDDHKGKIKYRCIEYKNSTLNNKEKCQAYFVTQDGTFIEDYNSNHSEHKFYNIEIERSMTLKYIKDEISRSPNKYNIDPKTIFNNIKSQYPNISNNYYSYRQNIYNYIEKERDPEPKSFDDINWDHPFFSDLNGENMLVSHSELGIVLQTREQAELCSLYQERYFFDGTFESAPYNFYQICPFRLLVPQYQSYELGGLVLLTGKTTQHYQFAFTKLKDNINKYHMRPGSFYPVNLHIDKENGIIAACMKVFPQTRIRLCYFHFSNNIRKRINNTVFKSLFSSNSNTLKCVLGYKGLSFIPIIYIIPVFELLCEKAKDINNPNLNNFMDYFKKEWVYGTETSYWNYYREFDLKTNNASEGYNHKINNIFGHKRPFIYHALFEYRNLIKEFLDNYKKNIINHGSGIIETNPLRNAVKNVLDKYDEDYLKLRRENENKDIDIDDDVYYNDDNLYELYSRHWFKCVLVLSEVINNIDYS